MRIGEFLVSKGLLNERQVDDILKHSGRTGLRFGEAALELGVITTDSLVRVFGPNWKVNFFHLYPKFLPAGTRDLFTPAEIVEYGIVALGTKTEQSFLRSRRFLNVGFLDPLREPSIAFVRNRLKSEAAAKLDVQDFKTYLVLADQLIGVLQEVYGVNPLTLKVPLDPTLQLFLGQDSEAGSKNASLDRHL